MESGNIINEKIEDLTSAMEASKAEMESLKRKINVLNECSTVITKTDTSMKNYDFSGIMSILDENNVKIEDLEQTIIDVKNIIEFYNMKGTTEFSIYDEYMKVLDELKSKLEYIKNQLNAKAENTVVLDYSNDISDLNGIISVMNKENGKALTINMLKALYTHILSKSSLEDVLPIYKSLNNQDSYEENENIVLGH